MGHGLADAFPVARRTFEEADDALGFGLTRLCATGPAADLARTELAQPAILTVSVAAWRVLRDTTEVAPAALAGHSLGEWSALVAAGALDLPTAVRGVRERGRLMQEAVPLGQGTMAAVMGLDAAAVAALCAEAADGQVLVPANLNGAGQVVVAGHTAAVDRLVARAKASRVRVVKLDVSAPFHCPLMAPAADGLARVLDGAAIRDPAIPVVTSVEARPVRGAADVRALLVAQLTAPVRWEATIDALDAYAPGLALEPGPGNVLTALLKRLRPAVPCIAVGDPAGVEAARGALA
jgi:[acyl-carrier-protein] S-malonyltransferase